MDFSSLPKLKKGDKVAIVSPSFAGPGAFPEVYELGLERIRSVFGLEPVEFPTTRKIGATKEERARDLIAAFEDPDIKAVIASLGGNDQVTYVKNLPSAPFAANPKPFLGYSDNSHFANHLWLHGIPSYYGGSVLTQFAMQVEMDPYTIEYIQHALFDTGEFELKPSPVFNDMGLDWGDVANLEKRREYEENEGWYWSGSLGATGITWGGCLESIDEMLRHNVPIPTLEQFENVVLITETSEELPEPDYVFRVFRALGERGILERIQGFLVGRPKSRERGKPRDHSERVAYRAKQREVTEKIIRAYNASAPIIQNVDFGHTDPQIPLPYSMPVRIATNEKKLFATF